MNRLFFILILAAALCACDRSSSPVVESLPSPTPAAAPGQTGEPAKDPAPTASDAPNKEEDESDADEITPFKLSDAEAQLFEGYIKDMDVSIFKDVPPISVAKVFIQCGITNNISAEYKLFSQEGLTDSEEEYIRQNTEEYTPLPEHERQRFADMLFGTLDTGEFVLRDDTHGYIPFENYIGEQGEFNMIKDADGIWRVKYSIFS